MKDAYARAVADVLARTDYGVRVEVPEVSCWQASWSNGSRNWALHFYKVKRGQQVNLDANEILIYAKTKAEAKKIASHLPALPLDAGSTEAHRRGPEQFLSNPRGQEREWLDGEESGNRGPTGEGDLAPWMQPGYSEFPMAGRVHYINAYTLVENRSSMGFQDNLRKYGNSHKVGVMPPEVQLGSDAYYTPFASIPFRREDMKARDSFFGYLVWLIKAVKLGFTRIEVEEAFPAAETNPYTGHTEGKVTLNDGRWFPFQTDKAFSHKHLDFVNAYTVNKVYGGGEEGGWWYETGTPIASIPVKKDFQATEKKWKDYLKMNVGWTSKYELSSVLGHDKFSVYTEDQFAEFWPRETPHYE